MLPLTVGVVKLLPIYIGEPPVGIVYQLNMAFGVDEDAVNVATSPGLTFRVGGVTAMSGDPPLFPPPDTFTVPEARVVETVPVTGSFASA